MSTINHITELLEGSFYKLAGEDISIGSITFSFELVFLGEQYASDIVVVADLATTDEGHLINTLRGLARALDFNRSSRPVTCIIIGESPSQDMVSELIQTCRVLSIANAAAEIREVKDQIRVLLPLEFVLPAELTANHKNELLSQLNKPVNDSLFNEFYTMAGVSQSSVSDLLNKKINRLISREDHLKSSKAVKW